MNADDSRPLPSHLLRGLRDKSFVHETGVDTGAYLPDPRTARNRTDGNSETSVNWEDDEAAVEFTLSKRDQTAFGTARLARAVIERIQANPRASGVLSCERKRLDDNPYHGNLLFRSDAPRPLVKQIAGAMALDSEWIKRPR